MRCLIFLALLLPCLSSFAQGLGIFRKDSNYYYKYDDRLVIALYQSYRSYNILFNSMMDTTGVSRLNYQADANNVTGIEINYDKFSLSFGIKSTPSDPYRVNTSYSNFNFSFGGNRWILETSYRKYKGFYEMSTSYIDSTNNNALTYYQDPSFANRSVRAKFFYFFNHRKFSYRAAYSCTYRQSRTALSWAFVGNIYQNTLSSDTSFFHPRYRHLYGSNSDLNRLGIAGISAGAGFSGNIVLLKSLFFNLTFVMGPEVQWRKYGHYYGRSSTLSYLAIAGDARSSIGFNTRNFFMTISSLNDFYVANGRGLELTTKFLSGAFSIGYRFKVKDPKFMQKVRENKFYKML